MKFGVLFWGFQDLNLVSEVAKKIKHSLGIKDFYVQIADSEKTMFLVDLYPEEIIRTKYDFNNLYHWLTKNSKKNVIVIIDLFNFIFTKSVEEYTVSLKKILALDFKFCFLAPKIIYPQSIDFINNAELISIYNKTKEYNKINKILYESIINSKSNSRIISLPVPENFTINKVNYSLFHKKNNFILNITPKILKKYSASFISQSNLITRLTEKISFFINDKEQEDILFTVDSDKSTEHVNYKKNLFYNFKTLISFSLERFFKLKSSSPELKFILWLIFLSICEFEIKEEEKKEKSILNHYFFQNKS